MRTIPAVALCALAGTICLLAWQANEGQSVAPGVASAPVEQQPQPTPGAEPARQYVAMSRSAARGGPACTITRHYASRPDGTSAEAISCQPAGARAPQPYERYPAGALESLAYADADAARILGMRLIEDDATAALSLVVRAAALAGGDPAPIRYFSSAYPHPVSINGVPQPRTVRVKYVLATVVALLGDETAASAGWESVIRAHSQDPEAELGRLNARARAIVDAMRRIQVEVSGTSTIGGQGDA